MLYNGASFFCKQVEWIVGVCDYHGGSKCWSCACVQRPWLSPSLWLTTTMAAIPWHFLPSLPLSFGQGQSVGEISEEALSWELPHAEAHINRVTEGSLLFFFLKESTLKFRELIILPRVTELVKYQARLDITSGHSLFIRASVCISLVTSRCLIWGLLDGTWGPHSTFPGSQETPLSRLSA